MKLTGAQIIIECLKEQGVDTIFGYPGGTILDVYDALYNAPEINHIITSHEQGAAHAADGYARATGKVGVCMATSGPGATNLVTGIATAYMDSVPLVAITCNVGVALLGKDSFQEVDIAGVVMPITKHSIIVKRIEDLAGAIRKAFYIAKSGRKGPVLVDITKNVTRTEYKYEYKEPKTSYIDLRHVTDKDINTAIDMINASKRPFMFVGGGSASSNAYEEVRALAKILQAPVCDSLMGKGVVEGTNPRYTGMLGMHGTKTSNLGMYKCDLLIVLGARFSDRCVGNTKAFAPQAKILQIDVDAAEINKNVKVDASIVGDVRGVLRMILPRLKQHDNPEWVSWIRTMQKEKPLSYDLENMTGPAIINQIYRITKGNAIISTDVGQHQMWTAQYYLFNRPGQLITSGGLGTMGYGLGAAIGAQFGCPDELVINITGDGCFRMNMNELATVSRNNLPIIEVIFNNNALGMVRQWQSLFYDARYSATVIEDNVDYVKVSEGLGVEAVKVKTVEEFKKAFTEAVNERKAMTIECVIDHDDRVYPMIPAGKANKEVFDEEDIKSKEK